jgi:hypothetical protein
LKKGDLGGFENLQAERIYGKRSNLPTGASIPIFSSVKNVGAGLKPAPTMLGYPNF